MKFCNKHNSNLKQDIDEYIIEVKNLHKYFGANHILKGIDLKVKKGELISIIGRSGCGKTTFLRCLNCLEILDRGSIRISGISLSRTDESLEEIKRIAEKAAKVRTNVSMPFQGYESIPSFDQDFQVKAHALRSRVGMLFQSFNLFQHMTVLENVCKAPVKVGKQKLSDVKEIAVEVLEKVGMDSFLDRYPTQLSGGQKQRVAIARALALNPRVMLYDEPTSALDLELVEEVTEVMQDLNRDGMTQLVVTHSMHFVQKASDKIIYFHEGEIVEYDTPAEMFANPKDQRTKDYLRIFVD